MTTARAAVVSAAALATALLASGAATSAQAGGARIVYRAAAALVVNERLPEITGDCRSTGSRQVEWRATVPRLELTGAAGQRVLATREQGTGRFDAFESRVVSPCPGAFENRFGGTPFRLSVFWDESDNRLYAVSETEALDEGEGSGWTHKGCVPEGRTSDVLDLGGTPWYTMAETSLTAEERRTVLAGRALTVRRAVDRTIPSAACAFGGDHFRVTASFEVVLTPLRAGGNVSGGGCTRTGTAGNDVLVGTAARDVICGLAGNDVLRGLGGNDLLRGDRGADRLLGGRGNDTLDGGPAPDRLSGEAGNDVFRARDGARDTASGGAGHDSGSFDRKLDRVTGVERRR